MKKKATPAHPCLLYTSGPDLFYYIREGGATLTSNLVTVFTTNTVITLTTNTVNTYVTNSLVTFTPTNTVTAIGMDICVGRTVVAAANCLGPIALVVDVYKRQHFHRDWPEHLRRHRHEHGERDLCDPHNSGSHDLPKLSG